MRKIIEMSYEYFSFENKIVYNFLKCRESIIIITEWKQEIFCYTFCKTTLKWGKKKNEIKM